MVCQEGLPSTCCGQFVIKINVNDHTTPEAGEKMRVYILHK